MLSINYSSDKSDAILFWKTWTHMKYKWFIERQKQRNMIFDDTVIDEAAQSCNDWNDVWIEAVDVGEQEEV